MAHKDIRIPFEIDGRRFEAVGFLVQGEIWVSRTIMLARVPDAIGEEDWVFLHGRWSQFPEKLRYYYLATARRHPDRKRDVTYFSFDPVYCKWYECWNGLDGSVDHGVLVLRRCE